MAKEIFPSTSEGIGFFSILADGKHQRHALIAWRMEVDGSGGEPILYPRLAPGARLIAEFPNGYVDHDNQKFVKNLSDLEGLK